MWATTRVPCRSVGQQVWPTFNPAKCHFHHISTATWFNSSQSKSWMAIKCLLLILLALPMITSRYYSNCDDIINFSYWCYGKNIMYVASYWNLSSWMALLRHYKKTSKARYTVVHTFSSFVLSSSDNEGLIIVELQVDCYETTMWLGVLQGKRTTFACIWQKLKVG